MAAGRDILGVEQETNAALHHRHRRVALVPPHALNAWRRWGWGGERYEEVTGQTRVWQLLRNTLGTMANGNCACAHPCHPRPTFTEKFHSWPSAELHQHVNMHKNALAQTHTHKQGTHPHALSNGPKIPNTGIGYNLFQKTMRYISCPPL